MGEELQRAQRYADELAGIYGDGLSTVLLYGSAARGEYRPGLSDLNLLVILEDVGIESIRKASAVTREWVSAGNAAPLILSITEWVTSSDVFPLEYSDIRDAHVVLAGRDPCGSLHISREHLRLQVEHELRARKIQLRAGLLVAVEHSGELAGLLLKSLPTLLVLYRAMLRVDGQSIPSTTSELVEAVSSHVGFDADPVHRVLRAREATTDKVPPLDRDVAAAYLETVERAISWMDGHEPREALPDEV